MAVTATGGEPVWLTQINAGNRANVGQGDIGNEFSLLMPATLTYALQSGKFSADERFAAPPAHYN